MILLNGICFAGRRWGETSIWLHTEADNDGATALYQASGYELHSTGFNPVPQIMRKALGLGKDRLYYKSLSPSLSTPRATEGTSDDLSVKGTQRGKDKVFIWDTVRPDESL